MCTLLCVCPPRVESLFPPVLSMSCSQILLAFKVWFSRNSSSHCWTPRSGSLTWGSEPSLQWVDFCGMCSPVCESPTQQLCDLILLWLRPSYCLIVTSPLSLYVGYLFWWVPVSSSWWLFRSQLWFWCSRKREWEYVLLLRHFEPISNGLYSKFFSMTFHLYISCWNNVGIWGSCKGKLIWGYTLFSFSGKYLHHPQSLSLLVMFFVAVPRWECLLRMILLLARLTV